MNYSEQKIIQRRISRRDILILICHYKFIASASPARHQTSPLEAAQFLMFSFNTLRPTQNGRHFTDILKWTFLNENVWLFIEMWLNFVPKGPINNIPALVQIMAWHRPGDKSLSEPMMVCLLTHICVTRPQWINTMWPSDTLWRRKSD